VIEPQLSAVHQTQRRTIRLPGLDDVAAAKSAGAGGARETKTWF
jgi:hypothetical protein